MSIKYEVVSAISKVLEKTCRLAKSGGTTLPGKVVSKIYPGALTEASENYKIIMVTGTNGKTTTTRLIGQILMENGIEAITNKSGANLMSGIMTTFLNSVNPPEKSSGKFALIEVDEAAFNHVCDFVKPDILVVTNFFRDQLDRYGELYTTLKNVRSGIEKFRDCSLVLNADDSLCASLGIAGNKRTLYYGIEPGVYKYGKEPVNSDAVHCIFCKSKYTYSYYTYGHLGGYRCTNCGYARPAAGVSCTGIDKMNASYSSIRVSIDFPNKHQGNLAKVNLPGLFNIYNSLSAIACSEILHLPVENSIKGISNCECGFGRMESIKVDGKTIKIILVKNPSSFNQALEFVELDRNQAQVAFLINDRFADGTDVSWLWDVDFERLQGFSDRIPIFYVSGTRAEDMAVRLKYAGIHTDKIALVKDYREVIHKALSNTSKESSIYLFPTYTAMLDIRKHLENLFNLKEFWR